MLKLEIDRDSVHAGDDCESHVVSISIDDSMAIEQLIFKALEVCTLPKISGGRATWFVYLNSDPKKYLGVVAQQWKEPKLLVPKSETIGSVLNISFTKLVFRYWCQSDPESVYEALASDNELPSKYT